MNYELIGKFVSYEEAKRKIRELLKLTPVNLDDLIYYLDIDKSI